MTEHLKGHASLAEMISTHVSSFRALISRAHMDKGIDRAYVDHELAALKAIETACTIEQASRATPADHSSLTTEEIQLAVKVWRERRTRMPDIAVQEAFTDGLAAASALFKRRATPADHNNYPGLVRGEKVYAKDRATEQATPADHIGDAAEKVDADSVPVATLPLVLTEQMRTAVKNWVQRYPVLGAGIYAQELWNDILAAAPQSPQKVSDTVRDAERVYPDDLTSELREVLGWPNFKCGPIAHLMVASGAQIKPKSEDEQAAVLHWLVKLVLAHGEDWKEAASAEIRSMQESLKSAPPLKPVSEETKP